MPLGPIIMSPDRSVRSGAREVIIKKPHIFKIGTLSAIFIILKTQRLPFINCLMKLVNIFRAKNKGKLKIQILTKGECIGNLSLCLCRLKAMMQKLMTEFD